MSDKILVCPECCSDKVMLTEETKYNANTYEHFCTSVKISDDEAKATCVSCWWEGVRTDLEQADE